MGQDEFGMNKELEAASVFAVNKNASENNPSERKIFGMLGLCRRAGKLSFGTFSVERSVKSGRAKLLIAAGDASANSMKKTEDLARFRSVPLFRFGTKETLGRAIGKGEVSSLSIEDAGFAGQIGKMLEVFPRHKERGGKIRTQNT